MIVALAQETGVPRNALSQRHLDLENDFCTQVRARAQTSDSEIRLRRPIVELRELRAKDVTGLEQLWMDVEHLVHAVSQLTAHSQQLLHPCRSPTSVSGRCRPSHIRAEATESLNTSAAGDGLAAEHSDRRDERRTRSFAVRGLGGGPVLQEEPSVAG
ncbi:hypothetical protein [Streptomyces sp. NPDC021356]|uniref:hypothetical protein n=1 Tax=Streptomyces sp. NPDC021356 TaxID=3154900 RepID=UPI0033FCDDF2